MLGMIAALVLLPAPPHIQNPFHAFRPHASATHRYGLPGGWVLSRTDDAFTATTACRLDRDGVRMTSGVVTFSFGHDVDTANALFRLDGGPLRTAGEVGPEVAGLGVSYLTGDTWNPSNGRVRVPWTTLAGVRRIDIRANPKRRPRTFELDSLDAAVATARGGGCTDLV